VIRALVSSYGDNARIEATRAFLKIVGRFQRKRSSKPPSTVHPQVVFFEGAYRRIDGKYTDRPGKIGRGKSVSNAAIFNRERHRYLERRGVKDTE
jgi:hypothetical protein